ncbi:hypothetical protein FQN57_006275 [Myotisia sp. PD_48]|nr:hypothetical protein FQN57_006275 [Myotisia sp. PD_48]
MSNLWGKLLQKHRDHTEQREKEKRRRRDEEYRKREERRLYEPPVPTLPKIRPRPITPVPCEPSATANSRLFQRLSSDIRSLILIAAFGGSYVHFDLRLLFPPKNKKKRGEGHARLRLHLDQDKPREWRWCGSVCHHIVRPWPAFPLPADGYYSNRDHCHEGKRSSQYPGGPNINCMIGALGWLLTCRQAYIEGIEVLYRTNWLCIEGTPLLRRVPDLLLPQRCSSITSLHLRWTQRLSLRMSEAVIPRENSPSAMDESVYILEMLPVTLPNLTYLQISFEGFSAPAELLSLTEMQDIHDMNFRSSERLLGLIDEMVRKLRLLSKCQVAVPYSVYHSHVFKRTGEEIAMFSDRDALPPLWRDLPAQIVENEGTHQDLKGYWIANGVYDFYHPRDLFMMSGFS